VKEYWVSDVGRSRAVVHRGPRENGYQVKLEVGPDDVLDGSVVGIGEIPVADVLDAAESR
jgi:hypothetical protein